MWVGQNFIQTGLEEIFVLQKITKKKKIKGATPKTQTHTHTHIYIYIFYFFAFGLLRVRPPPDRPWEFCQEDGWSHPSVFFFFFFSFIFLIFLFFNY
jgi:hypothetical protein